MGNKTNRWIILDEEYCRFECPDCGKRFVTVDGFNYCPKCGSIMVEDLQSCSCGNNGKCHCKSDCKCKG